MTSIRERDTDGSDTPKGLAVAHVSAALEIPENIVERIRAHCLALPEVAVRVDHSSTRARSTAHSFDIRRRSFCLLVAKGEPDRRVRPAAGVASVCYSPTTQTGRRSVSS
jgi:hypothetical protein